MASSRKIRRSKRFIELLEHRHLLAGDLVAQWTGDSLNDLSDGDSVLSWSDSIGGVEALRRGDPKLAKQLYGGRSAVRFDARDGDDEFRIKILENPINRADDFSVVVVFATDSQDLSGNTDEWFRASGLVDANSLGFSNGWGVSINSSGRVGAGLEAGFGQPVKSLYSDVSDLNDGLLHSVAFTRTGGTLSLYVDDLPPVTTNDGSTATRTDTEISIGDVLGAGPGFVGDIAEVRLYDGALTTAEWDSVRGELDQFFDNRRPVAAPDEYTLDEDVFFFSVPEATGLLANDTDADGDALTAVLVEPPAHGSLVLDANGSFVYDPDPDFFGQDTFRYAAVDFRPSEPTTVVITVDPTYDPAIPVPDEYKGLSRQVLEIPDLLGVLANDTNVDANPLTASITRDVADGRLTLNPNGSFSYDPQGFSGVTSFEYRLNDGVRDSIPATVTLTINTPPAAQDDVYRVDEDTMLDVDTIQGVLANDTDIDGNTIVPTIVNATQHGSLTFDVDGSFHYEPNPDFFGTDTFTYQVADQYDTTPELATVTLVVDAVNDAPIARADLYLTFIDTVLTVLPERGVLSNDSDVEEQPLTATVVEPPRNGTLELRLDGGVTYTPRAGFEGTDRFRYRANDGLSDSDDTTVTLIVAPTDEQIVINEVHYDPPDNTMPAEFIELFNQGSSPVDVSNWFLTDAIRYVIPAETVIAPQSYLVIAQDPTTMRDLYSTPSVGPYEGRLSSGGEEIVLRNAAGNTVDRVDYQQGFPWPIASGGDGPSMELIHPALDNQLGGSWRASLDEPTPGQANSVHASEAPPQTRQVSHSPQQPKAGEATVVTAKVTDPNGVAAVELEYQVVRPGHYIPALLPLSVRDLRRTPDGPREVNPEYVDPANWTTLVMVDDGTSGDAVADDDIYTATIPGQAHRTLMRYRLRVTDMGSSAITVPYEDDASRNFAYFVYDGVPDYGEHSAESLQSVPVYHVIARNEDVTTMMGYSSRDQIAQGTQARFAYNWPAAFVYDGVVHDNINMRLRGANGRYHLAGKRSMRFRFNDGHYFQAKNQDGEEFTEEWRTLTTGKMFDNRQTQTWALNENINMFLFEQLGVPAAETYYVHFRVIDSEEESPDQWSGDFWGLNFILETYDVRFLDHHNLEAGNLYKLINQTTDWEQQQRYQAPNAVNDGTDHDNIEANLRGRSTADYINSHVNLEKYFQYHAFTEAIRHYDYWPNANKNMVYYFEPDYLPENDYLGKLWILPWDTDASWGPTWNSGHDVVYNSIFATSGGGGDRDTTEELWPSYYNAVREIRDLLWQRDQIEPLIEQFADVLRPLAAADLDRWRGSPASEGRYNGLSGAGTRGIDAIVEDMKNFAFEGGSWPGGSVPNGGRARHLDRLLTSSRADDEDVPATPILTYTGGTGYPVDGLRFRTSEFVDAQGTDTFVAMEWRIAEVTDSSAPTFDASAKLHLEWNASWESGELSEFAAEISPPTSAVEPGHAYRARVRMKDNQGHWSHWSQPIQFVASAANSSSLVDSLRISEIHYHPVDPSQDEVTAGFDDADDFEFLELVNIGTSTLDLRGAELIRAELDGDSQGIDFRFVDGSIHELAPGQRVLVVEDVDAFVFRYGQDLPVTGQWSGALSNGGEQITLMGDGFQIQQFVYRDDWYPTTDGQGPSLEFIQPSNPDLSSWGRAASWRASDRIGGSPGQVSGPIVGDANGDGRFDSSDLVAVFTAGEYEDALAGNSTFSEGDWNGDGDFTSSDLVLAFRLGHYAAAVAADLAFVAAPLRTGRAAVANTLLDETRAFDFGALRLKSLEEETLRARDEVFVDFDDLGNTL